VFPKIIVVSSFLDITAEKMYKLDREMLCQTNNEHLQDGVSWFLK